MINFEDLRYKIDGELTIPGSVVVIRIVEVTVSEFRHLDGSITAITTDHRGLKTRCCHRINQPFYINK
jgi:hypothetical protein